MDNHHKKTILIDMDDTIENLCESWCDYLNREYGMNVQSDDISDWDMSEAFPKLSIKQIFEPLLHDEFWKSVKPREDAMKYVEKLFNDGYNVYICTATDYRSLKAKYEYIIKRYFPYIDWKYMIITNKKQLIKADYMVDDGIHNLIGGDYTKILMTASHNKNFDASANDMFRADNWEEAYKIIVKSEDKKP